MVRLHLIKEGELDQEALVRQITEERELKCQAKGVMSKSVHDWLHVRTAKLAGAEVVLSRDAGLSGLCRGEGLKAEWP
jgi:hypothetical protein